VMPVGMGMMIVRGHGACVSAGVVMLDPA